MRGGGAQRTAVGPAATGSPPMRPCGWRAAAPHTTALRERPPTVSVSACANWRPMWTGCFRESIREETWGADVFYSGTVAAVREGVLEGCAGNRRFPVQQEGPSHRLDPVRPLGAALAGRAAAGSPVGRELLEHQSAPPGARAAPIPPTVCCPLDLSPLPVTFRKEAGGFLYAGNYHQRRYAAGTDVDVCFRGEIAVTRVRLG